MRRAMIFLLMTLGFAGAVEAQEYRPSFQPDQLKDRPASRPNEVLVLGSPHLSGLPDSFRPEMVEPVLARLAAWRPTAIAIENMPGLLCDSLRRQPKRYASTVEAYCFDPSAAGRATGLDVPAANMEAEQMLANWPKTPSPAQRRGLAAVFLAAGEPTSALVQWLRLPAEERRADDRLTTALATELETRRTRKNESELVAAQLATRLGLERVWNVDDQSYFAGERADEKAYGAALTSAWDNPATKARLTEYAALNAGLAQPNGLLEIYRKFNAPSYAALAYKSDWGAALTEKSPQAYGRRYVAYWETRNLRMVANIRQVLGRDPGTRLLAIVGASHKGYYEAYLNQMRDVKLADMEAVLR